MIILMMIVVMMMMVMKVMMMMVMVMMMVMMIVMMWMMVMTKVNGQPRSTGSPANKEYNDGDGDDDIVCFVVSFVDMTCFK